MGKIFSKGGEKNCRDNNTYNNKKTTTTADDSKNQPDLIEGAPSSDETAAAAVLSPEDIKTALLTIDRSLLLKTDFYSRAAAFMSLNSLDRGYFVWLYKQVELRKPDSFEGLFFTLFFAENMVEKYKISKLPEEKPPPETPLEIKCPVCGTIHDKEDEICPECSLPNNPLPDQISLFKFLYSSFPPDKRKEYLQKYDDIFSSLGNNFIKIKTMKEALNMEFGITIGDKVNVEEPSRSYYS